MRQFVRHYLLSLQFFTRIPVTGRLAEWVGYSPAMLRASAGHFPGVGLLVGVWVAVFSGALLCWLGTQDGAAMLVAVLATAGGVFITGAFHEDGLADVADGLGGSAERVRALEIMKDSRVGAYGVVALVLALQCKVALLALLATRGGAWLMGALVLAHVTSRTWPLLTIRLLTHVGDAAGSKSKPLADQIGIKALASGWLWCAVAWLAVGWAWLAAGVVVSLPAALLAAGLGSGLVWLGLLRWFRRRLGGFTGDCLGATQQGCELACYLGLVLAA